MARHAKRAEEELAALEQRHKASSEQLLVAYRDVLTVLKGYVADERADQVGQASLDDRLTVKRIREVVEGGGGFEAQLAKVEALAAYRGGNWTPLVERFFRPDRPTMFKLARTPTFVPTSRDRSVLDALEHAVAHRHLTRELIPTPSSPPHRRPVADPRKRGCWTCRSPSSNGARQYRRRISRGCLVRRHFEAMIFTYLIKQLRWGDIAVVGTEDFGDWTQILISLGAGGAADPRVLRAGRNPQHRRRLRGRPEAAAHHGHEPGGRRVPGQRGPHHRPDHRSAVPQTAPASAPPLPPRWRPNWTAGCPHGGSWSTWPEPRTGPSGGTGSARCPVRTRS
ncbi:hypothetical protein ACIQWN_38100 [Streptomyces vinaceus]|uniref:hypothetical protein n=1 Tax=Streptomyces vinaceus TaxID=1960 RepID=UPI003810C4DC